MNFGSATVIIHDRQLFMQQAYTALYNGTIEDLPADARRQVVAEVTQDLLGVIRGLSPDCFEAARTVALFREQLLQATRPN